jgi:hypothetical protein
VGWIVGWKKSRDSGAVPPSSERFQSSR